MIFMVYALLAAVAQADDVSASAMLAQKINQARSEAGSMPLQRVRMLDQASQWFAEDLARRSGVLDHVDSQGRRVNLRIYDYGYRAIRQAAENLAQTTSPSSDPLNIWIQSSGHRRSLLTPAFEHMGIGVSTSREGHTYWVVAFGQRFKGAPPIEL